MSITKNDKEKVIALVADYLSSAQPQTRKEIIDGVLDKYGFTDKEKKNNSPTAKYNIIRSYIGTVLTYMTNERAVVKQGDKYFLAKEKSVVVSEEQCKNAILSFLRKRPYTKKELYSALQKHFQTYKTKTLDDDNALKGMAGNLLSSMLICKTIIVEDDKYSLAVKVQKKTYPKSPVAEETFKVLFLERLCDLGGPFFEKFVANLLEKYFLITGRDVLNCSVIGGSDDGGIDVKLDTIEDLGFTERIMVQAKCRKNIQVTEKEVREFYGALNAQGGTRGIYITTSSFHPCAEKLLISIDNCVGIDGNKVFDLVKKTTYGIRKNKDGYLFDETIFNI